MNRRDMIALLGGAAMLPVAARAQPSRLPVIGFLDAGTPEAFARVLAGYRQGLNEAGFVEGRNVAIEWRWAGDRYDRLQALAAELVQLKVAVISAGGAAAPAAKAATSTIPVVFVAGIDPVAAGLVASLNRPGGNVTGVTNITGELSTKRLDLVRELVPKASVVALLWNPSGSINAAARLETRDLEAAVRSGGRRFEIMDGSTEREIDAAFQKLVQIKADALLVAPDTYLLSRREQIVGLAEHYAIPAIYNFAEFPAAGGLMSYGASRTDSWRQMGVYTGRILKGEKPADLPIMQPTIFELVINLKAAKAIGLTMPPSLLARADEVIE
jgi:putative ABC transport system substrate-binding protein